MTVEPRRAALVAVALAEVGAVIGATTAWSYLVGRTLLWDGPLGAQALLGAGVWALLVGAPLGAVLAPLLGLTVLRRAPLRRALGLPALGALVGLAVGALASGARATAPILPIAEFSWGLGLLVGVMVARANLPGARAAR